MHGNHKMNPMPMNTAPMITITNKQTHPKMMHGKSPMQYHQISPQAAHVSHPLSLLFILNKEIDFLKSKMHFTLSICLRGYFHVL